MDPFFPKAWGTNTNTEAERVDMCLGHPQAQGIYHYHFMPPCIFNAALDDTAGPCLTGCSNNLINYGLSGYTTKKTLTPIGIAKDGHIIYGPYDSTGKTWVGTEVDICNGKMIDGVYGYVASTFHPYFVGCWGPGNYPTFT